jgi:hypothetical protein
LALCYGEGEWPWKCEELSKHTQKLSPRNSEIILCVIPSYEV